MSEDLTKDINKYADKYLNLCREQYRELRFLYKCILKEQATMCICERLKDHPNIYCVKMKKPMLRRIYYAFLTTPGKI